MKRLIYKRTASQAALFGLICLCLHGLLAGAAQAGTAYTWLGEGFSNNWEDTTGNWDGGSNYPGFQALIPDDTAYFGAAPQSYNTLLSGLTVISNITYGAPGYTLVVNGFLTATNGISATATNAPNIVVGSGVRFDGTATIRNLTGGGTLGDYSGGGAIVNVVGPSSTFNGDIQGIVALNVGGNLFLNGLNTSTGNIAVQSGGKLGGTGTVGGSVTVQAGGSLAPGTTAGQFTLTSGLSMQAGSALEMELTSASLFDRLDVQGTFVAGGTLNLLIGGGYAPVYGTSFTIFNGATPGFDSGIFQITTNLADGLSWETSALAGSGIMTIVPEPTTGLLVVLGSMLLFYRAGSGRVCGNRR